jgi:hypothetical protein
MTSSCRWSARSVGGLDFSNYYIALAGQDPTLPLLEAKKIGAVFAYGNFADRRAQFS